MSTFLTFDQLTEKFLPVLRDRLVLPGLITIDPEAAAEARVGKKVAMTKPRRRTVMKRTVGATAAITPAHSREDEVSITLTDDLHDAQPITDAQLTLDIRDFGRQVLSPMLDAVVDGMETEVSTLIEGATYQAGGQLTHTVGTSNVRNTLVDAGLWLDDQEVPDDDRFLICGRDFFAQLMKDDHLTRVDQSGDSAALRRATIGELMNFRIVKATTKISANKAYFAHRSAYMAALRAPVVPAGAVDGSSREHEGVPLTMFRDYDPTTTEDRIFVRTFYGDTVNLDHEGLQNAAYNGVFKRAGVITVNPAV